MAPALTFVFWSFHIALILSSGVHGFSWGGNKRISSEFWLPLSMQIIANLGPGHGNSIGPSSSREHLASTPGFEPSKLPAMYSMALNELQELESEPLCHRIAARLLVNNCQLLDGRDDETILTDSGRAARDFVDSYAASLAICDLERGSFAIPPACSKFQESTLARIAPPTKPQLHVTTAEIDDCLEGLAQSDSAWNTWVSYHHKTLRFCEAARADNEKNQNVRLHQRLVDILARLTTQLEEEMGERFRSLNQMFQEVETATANLKPQMNDLKNGFTELDTFFREQIVQRVQRSTDFINHGLEDARNLQILLAMLVDATQTQSHDLVSSHESALQEATQRITTEVDIILSAIAAAVTSSTSLHREIEVSQSIAAAVALRQEKIETNMKRLEGLADSLLVQHEGHQERLVHAQQTASNLIDLLDSASSSAATLRTSIYNGLGLSSWWPYIFCPLTSLVVGSYGLPPSATRNLMLISLGEIAGFGVSIAKRYGGDMHTAFTSNRKMPARANSTTASDEDLFSYNDFANNEVWRVRFNKNV